MTGSTKQERESRVRGGVSAVVIGVAVLAVVFAWARCISTERFRSPIAYTMVGDKLFVVEKENNTVLQLAYRAEAGELVLDDAFELEKDKGQYYYMLREVYPGSEGVITHSYIYERRTDEFVGYRFREYSSFENPPREILTIFLKNAKDYPEISYACGPQGNHFFVNNCADQYNIWRMHSPGGVTIRGGKLPPSIQQLGETNKSLSSWAKICIGPENHIFVSSSATGRIVEYGADGVVVRRFGTVGFEEGSLLASDDLSFTRLFKGQPNLLTVASTGNRTWVQFDSTGRSSLTVLPLEGGYPFQDILVGAVYLHDSAGEALSFDRANKCLVLHDRGFKTLSTYRSRHIGRAWLVSLLAVAMVLAILVCRRVRVFPSRFRFPFFLKLMALFVPLLVASALVVGDWVKDIMKADLETESLRRSANLARAIINTVSLSDLQSIQQPEDRQSPVYERIHATVSKLVDTKNVESTPKWIIHKIRNGRFYFGINIWRGPIYEPFIVPRDRRMFFDVLEMKTPQSGRFVDDQGEWFSYLSPVVAENGSVPYVVELYRPAEAMDRSDRKASQRVMRVAGATALIAALLVLIFSYIFTRPLRKLMQGTSVVSKGDFSQEIHVRSHDEMGDLAGAFNQMVHDLRQYTSDLERTTAEKERIEGELRFAREVQQGIIPTAFPPFERAENVEICARIEPAREVGGDYYDFFLVDRNHIGVVIADVSGKGAAAGLFMVLVRTLLRSNSIRNLSAADAVSRTNRLIAGDNPSSMFVTMFYMICNMKTGKIVFCDAGHNPPVLLGHGKARFLRFKKGSGRGVVLGPFEESEYTDGELQLKQGEVIVLYTDGVTEAVNKAEQEYGEERLVQEIEANSDLCKSDLCAKIYDDVQNHQKGLEQFDDITLLLFGLKKIAEKPRNG